MTQDALEGDFATLIHSGDNYLETEPGNPFPIPGWRVNITRLGQLSIGFSMYRTLFSPLTFDIRQRAIAREIGILQIMIDEWTDFAEVIRYNRAMRRRLARVREEVEERVGPL
jgi:hypothetical protein